MYKFLKVVAPVILVIFISTSVIAPAFGAGIEKVDNNKNEKIGDVQIDMLLYSYDLNNKQAGEPIEKPSTGDMIKMELKVQGKGSQVVEVKLLNNAFTQIDSYKEQDESPWIHRKAFILGSPDKPGVYPCTFECTDKDGNSALVSMALEVIQKAPVTQPAPPGQIITPGQPAGPGGQTVQPVYTAKGTMYYTHTIHMDGWSGMFWFGFIVGVIVAAVCFAAGATSAAK